MEVKPDVDDDNVYVTFETAKLAYQKGWNGFSYKFFETDGDQVLEEHHPYWYGQNGYMNNEELHEDDYHITKDEEGYIRPTQAVMQRWLRKRNIQVNPGYSTTRGGIPLGYHVSVDKYDHPNKGVNPYINDPVYEICLEKGLQLALTLLPDDETRKKE